MNGAKWLNGLNHLNLRKGWLASLVDKLEDDLGKSLKS